jgi:16S rRNA C967 or C1407 C5-methylase (RsmB/RsmF family)
MVWREQFDRILLDAPCSATGVIRRHPDIKWLRRDRDISELAQLQAEILDAIWPHLKPGGTLVYATCSVLPEENSQQIAAFLARTDAASAKRERQNARVSRICRVLKKVMASFTLSSNNKLITGRELMKIIILGAGQVGGTLAENLVGENNDITVVIPMAIVCAVCRTI